MASSSLSLLALVLLAVIVAVTSQTTTTLNLSPDELEEYQDPPFSARLGGAVILQCNGTFFTLYNVNKELYDNCTIDATSRALLRIFDCNERDPTRMFTVRLESLLFFDRFVHFQRGQTYYFAAFGTNSTSTDNSISINGINDSTPCLQGTKFAIHIINESTLSSTIQMSSTVMPASSTVPVEISTTPVVDIQRTSTVQLRTSTVNQLPTTTQPPTRPPITDDKPTTGRLADEIERDAIIAAAVSTVLGVIIIIGILGMIAFLLVLIIQKRQKRKGKMMVDGNLTEKPESTENPLFLPALGNVDLPTTPKTPKEIRFQNMYSDLEDFTAKKKRRQTWLF